MTRRFGLGYGITLLVVLTVLASGIVSASPGNQTIAPSLDGPSPDVIFTTSLPSIMPYQGILKDGSGNLINGTRDITFALYRYSVFGMPSNWSKIWEETQTLTIVDGVINTQLGLEEPLAASDFGGLNTFGGSLELGIRIDGGTELTPRTKILPVPYAYRSQHTNRIAAPTYTGAWQHAGIRPDDISMTFEHNLGGNPDNYLVDLQVKVNDNIIQGRESLAYVSSITDSEVNVWVKWTPYEFDVRVRVWTSE